MSSRRKSRELALQLLFQEELTQFSPDEILDTSPRLETAARDERDFAQFLFLQYLENRLQIDKLIRHYSQNWKLERMAVVDRNILRMAVSEFLYTDTPRVVVINEAIEIARRFSTEDSSEFVNGILDAIRKELDLKMVEEELDGRQ